MTDSASQNHPPASQANGQQAQWAVSWMEFAKGQAPSWATQLMASAEEAWESAWAPYSNFRVGAAARLADGRILQASNQENASYPQGMCAERVLLFHHGAAFGQQPIEALAIAAERAKTPGALASWLAPCGGCRQVMLESEQRQGKAIQVVLQHPDGRIGIWASARDFLPLAFDGSMLQ